MANLDVLAWSQEHTVAIASKCTEFVTLHHARFPDAYTLEILDKRRDGPWFADMERLNLCSSHYRHLDTNQLIKPAFWLADTFECEIITLLYLFWEPSDGEIYPVFKPHGEESEDFACRLEGSYPAFS